MHKFKLGQYKGLEIIPDSMFTENDLEVAVIEMLANLTDQWAKTNKTAEHGDEVTVTLFAECEGIFVPELSKSNFTYSIGDPKILAQFQMAIGKKKNDTFEMSMQFPENFSVERVANKVVFFKATLHEVITHQRIELDDNIAKQIDAEVSSVEELKSKLRKVIADNGLQTIRQNNLKAVLDTVIANCSYEFDPELLNKVCEELVTETKRVIINSSNFEALQTNFLADDYDDFFYDDCMILAKKSILEELALNEIIYLEDVCISDIEVQAARTETLEELKGKEQIFENIFPTEEAFREGLLKDKALNSLLEWNLKK